jgi:hypothetical protein
VFPEGKRKTETMNKQMTNGGKWRSHTTPFLTPDFLEHELSLVGLYSQLSVPGGSAPEDSTNHRSKMLFSKIIPVLNICRLFLVIVP